MGVLSNAYGALIASAKKIAEELIKSNGTVTSRQVRAEMAARGLLVEADKEHWLGAVFRDRRFEWTGKYSSYSDEKRNIHERTSKVWKLRAVPTKEFKDGDILVSVDNTTFRYLIGNVRADAHGVEATYTVLSDGWVSKIPGRFPYDRYTVEKKS
jgi:hypothetical protein